MKNISGFRLRGNDADSELSRANSQRSGLKVVFVCGAVFGFSLLLVLVGMAGNENGTIIGGAFGALMAVIAMWGA